ncbi:uncharacterized protein FFMR_07169 [Fusarium fujikuroi]|nr:uncharacterized protein FFMR_07169 [Fusarium fujikuroi]
MGSSNLKWVNGSTHRAQDVSNDAVDKYKTIVQQLYLDKNMTREEVLNHLKEGHGFSLSTNQFSKATKRWGFYKQPRHGRAANPPPQSIMKEYDAYNPFDPQEELLKMEPDALDTIDEIEACSQTGSEIVTISLILEDFEGQFPFTKPFTA